ncbi:hypothetical protein [Frankia sp. R82]|uniref:hypothetical protein n=1 Tax=Frankia sp. R82 TaxID=2950553 RepID=UPI00204356F1|nr:hypothetical protein [Frankia sp. R82]MCM3886141.1 hypothetical protein [Frankia sp. R82]
MTGGPIIPADLLEPTSADMAELRTCFRDCLTLTEARCELIVWASHIDDIAEALTAGDTSTAARYIRLIRAARRVRAEWSAADRTVDLPGSVL